LLLLHFQIWESLSKIAGEHSSWYQALDRKYRKYGKGHPFSTLHLTVLYPYDMHNRVLHMITYILRRKKNSTTTH
jgi:hypothetical protein